MNPNSHEFRTRYQTLTKQIQMKKLFQQIDDLCVTASIAGICAALQLEYRFGTCGFRLIRLGGREHSLPDYSDRLWRRKWRKFLTNHVDDVAKNLDEAAAAAHASQPCSGV